MLARLAIGAALCLPFVPWDALFPWPKAIEIPDGRVGNVVSSNVLYCTVNVPARPIDSNGFATREWVTIWRWQL